MLPRVRSLATNKIDLLSRCLSAAMQLSVVLGVGVGTCTSSMCLFSI